MGHFLVTFELDFILFHFILFVSIKSNDSFYIKKTCILCFSMKNVSLFWSRLFFTSLGYLILQKKCLLNVKWAIAIQIHAWNWIGEGRFCVDSCYSKVYMYCFYISEKVYKKCNMKLFLNFMTFQYCIDKSKTHAAKDLK